MNEPKIANAPEKFYAQAAWAILDGNGGSQIQEFAARFPMEWRSISLSVRGYGTNLSVFLRFMSTMAIKTYPRDRDAGQAMGDLFVIPMQRALAPIKGNEGGSWAPRFYRYLQREELGPRGDYEMLDFCKLLNYVFVIAAKLAKGENFTLELPDGWAMRVEFKEVAHTVSYDDMPEAGEMIIVEKFAQRPIWISPQKRLEEILTNHHSFREYYHQKWPRFRQAWGGEKPFLQIVEDDPAEEAEVSSVSDIGGHDE